MPTVPEPSLVVDHEGATLANFFPCDDLLQALLCSVSIVILQSYK
uniref:Uncharacterized protein n=1 Tax=Arundo donax TaxID=35708 RepID=A0A0A8YRZ8_ARUDO